MFSQIVCCVPQHAGQVKVNKIWGDDECPELESFVSTKLPKQMIEIQILNM